MSELSYRIVGEGPPLLLLHGFGITHNIWQALIPLLKDHFQLILVELPGIGASPPLPAGALYYAASADKLDELRHKLGWVRWSILGYSTGTRVAEAYIRQHGHAIERCVLLCPLRLTGWRWHLLQGLVRADAVLPTVGRLALSGVSLFCLVVFLGFNGRLGPHPRAWTREIGAQPIDVLKKVLRDIPDDGGSLLDLPAPARYIWGRQDLITVYPRRASEAHVYINAPHAAPILAAQDVAQLTIEFLN